jgi:anti-sigma B factor antagonist
MDIHWHEENGIIVVRFRRAAIADQELIQSIGTNLLDAVAAAERTGKMLINFEGVLSMSSAMIGKLVLLNKKAKQCRIDLKFCCIHPNVLEVFRITRLNRVFRITSEPAPDDDGQAADASPFDLPFRRYLAERNLSWTKERQAILAAINIMPLVFSGNDVLTSMDGDLEPTTVFYTLFELWDAGLLEQVDGDGAVYYAKRLPS